MTWPSVGIDQLNQYQGTTTETERVVLFLGTAASGAGTLSPVNDNTDLDTLLGDADSVLKSNVTAARRNAGVNFFAWVYVLAADFTTTDWVAAVKGAQATAKVEGFVLCDDIVAAVAVPPATQSESVNSGADAPEPQVKVKTKKEAPLEPLAEIEANPRTVTVNPAALETISAAIALRADLITQHSRWVWSILSIAAPAEDITWAQYCLDLTALQNGIAGPSVQLVPRLWGNEPGVLAGRLCNRAVTIADSPARVKTGALIDIGSDVPPVDGAGKPIQLADLQALNAARCSVPMWYEDYAGMYWSDGLTLEVEGGDYSVIEYLRTVDKAARKVRLLAIPKIADRSLNSTPGSIAAAKTYFGRPLRDMSKSVQINNVTFPGEVKPPRDGDVVIQWKNNKSVAVYLTVRPYECPKEITVGILLDSQTEQAQ